MTRLPRQQLIECGRAARKQVQRRSHSVCPADSERADPLEILARQDTERVPELIELRHSRMSASPFTFLRGAAAVMASDLSRVPATPIHTQLCGDAHLLNIEIFATPERRLVFDITDFDETIRGPFEWDLKRMSTSLVVAARHRGFRRDAADEAVYACLASYRATMRKHRDADVLDVHYSSVSERDALAMIETRTRDSTEGCNLLETAENALARARRRTSKRAAQRLTEIVDGKLRMREDPPVLSHKVLPDDRETLASRFLESYKASLPKHKRDLLERFELVDVARRVVGVGSVGTRCYVILLHGRDQDDPLVLQVKEAGPSVLEPYIAGKAPRPHGRRVVEGQRTMQTVSDIFLGWLQAVGPDGVERDFYLRQFRDMKGSVDIDNLDPSGLSTYAKLCGHLLANGHARGGEPAEIAGYLGKSDGFIEALTRFSHAYADRTEQDHALLQAKGAS